LEYAKSPIVCKVWLGGGVVERDDKAVGMHRHTLWAYDATDVLRHFARLCALDVIDLWDAPDVIRKYLEMGDEGIRNAAKNAICGATRTITWDIAWNATAWTAARDAAWTAARNAAWAATWADAWNAAWTAARNAASTAARDAANVAQNKRLEQMLMEGRP
jgi:hypothetical protein